MEQQPRDALVTPNRRPQYDGNRALLVEGMVVSGDQRGRTIGFPTANIALDDPAQAEVAGDGVWVATVVLSDGSVYAATVSVGRRVTFYGREGVRLLEAYLLDFSGDLYGQHLQVWLHSRIRLQRRFPDAEALCEQIAVDVADTQAWAATRVWSRSPGTSSMIDPLAGLA